MSTHPAFPARSHRHCLELSLWALHPHHNGLSFATVALLCVTSLSSAAPAAGEKPGFVNEDRPIQDMVVWNPNWDDTHTPESEVALTKHFSPDLGFVVAARECSQFLGSTEQNPRPTPDWDSKALRWLRDIHKQPWMQGRGMLLEPLATTVPIGDPPFGAEWEKNMRWKYYVLAKQFPEQEKGIWGWIHANEPDNFGMQGLKFIQDFSDKRSNEAVEASVRRNVMYARCMFEQLRGINQPADMKAPAHPGFLIGPAGAFAMDTKHGPALWSPRQFLSYNGGEVLDYYDAVDYHFHNYVASTVETFDDQKPATALSPYHVWRAMQDANSVRVAAGKSPRLLPLVTGEDGWGERNWSSVGQATSSEAAQFYPDLPAYKGYKLAGQFCGVHWYGLSMWANYAVANSHARTDYNLLGKDYRPKLHYEVAVDIQDWRKYDIKNLKKYPLAFAAKDWRSFNRPYTWAVHYDASRFPTADDLPPAIPFPAWRTVKFQDRSVSMAASENRNLVYRPVYLRRLVPHRFLVDVRVSDGATVKLRARGYDKLNGLAQALDTSKESRTLSVEFTPRQHNMGRDLPDPAYVLIALDHDGKGTATWSNPRITVLSPGTDNSSSGQP
jgi:hypothetical protein